MNSQFRHPTADELEDQRAARLGPRMARLLRYSDWTYAHPGRWLLIGTPVLGVLVIALMATFNAIWQALPIDPALKTGQATLMAGLAVIVFGGILVNIEVRRRIARGIRQRTGVGVAWWRIPVSGMVEWEHSPLAFDAWLAQERSRPAEQKGGLRGPLLVVGLLLAAAAFLPLVLAFPPLAPLGALFMLLIVRRRSE